MTNKDSKDILAQRGRGGKEVPLPQKIGIQIFQKYLKNIDPPTP